MNTTSNSRPFALCSVISVTRRVLLVVLVLLADQGDLLQEVGHAALRAALLELGRDADELAEVLDPALGLDGALLLQLRQVARLA